MHTAELFGPDSSASEVEDPIVKLNSYKSPDVDQIPAEMIQAAGETLRSEIHKLIKLISKKGELPLLWKESVLVPIHKKGNKVDHVNYRGISLLLPLHKNLPKFPLSRRNPHADEIIGDHQCGFRRNRSTTDKIFYIRKIRGGGGNGSIFVEYISFS
jgi:hypothetical protein